MRFLNPTGLWLLLGIPVLVVIWVIRSQHEDRSVSSTYIWKLSSRFMKKRLPMQKLRKVLLFVLQLLMVATTALAVARPAIYTGKSCEYIAIIDASASMRTKDEDGISRFDRALEQVDKLSSCIERGHTLSIILAGDSASFLLQSADSVNRVHLALESALCGYGSSDIQKALALAAPLCSRSDAQVYFYTDTPYPKSENIRIVDLNRQEWNLSVDALELGTGDEGEQILIGTLTSHNRDASVDVGLRADGIIESARSVQLSADTPTQVIFSAQGLEDNELLELFVEESDALAEDNRYVLCAGHQRIYNVLLASTSPLYLQSAFLALGNCQVTTVRSQQEIPASGFDLYVFDQVYPNAYPTDGSVIQFGTDMLPTGLGALPQKRTPDKLTAAEGTDDPLFADLSLQDTTLARYRPLSGNAAWQTVLRCGSDSVCMTQDPGSGQRFTLFGFDLHHSNLPMQADFMVLIRNLVEVSVFDLLSQTDHTAGQTVSISVLPAAQQLYVQLPEGSIKTLSTEAATAQLSPQEPGVYTAVITTARGSDYADFFVHIPRDESLYVPGDAITVITNPNAAEQGDAITEIWVYLAGLLLILLLAEWGVYHSEQY